MQGRQANNGAPKAEPNTQQAGGFDYQTFQQSAHEWQGLDNWPASSDGQTASAAGGDQGEFAPLESLVQPSYVGANAGEHMPGAGPSDWTTLGGAEGQGEGEGHGDDGEYLPEGHEGQNPDGEEHRPTPRGKKLALACHFCRKRKLKCDGQQPTCENCKKRNQTCEWDAYIRRRGPGRRTKEQRERSRRETDAAGVTLGDVTDGDIQATAEALAQVEGTTGLEHNTLADSLDGPPIKRRKAEDGIGVGVGVGLGGNGGYSLHHHHLAGPEEIPDINDASFDNDLEGLEALQSLDGLHAIRELSAQDLGAVVGQVVQEHQAQQAAAHDDDPTIDPALKG